MVDTEQCILDNHQELSTKLLIKSEDDIEKFNKINEDIEKSKRKLKKLKKQLEII